MRRITEEDGRLDQKRTSIWRSNSARSRRGHNERERDNSIFKLKYRE